MNNEKIYEKLNSLNPKSLFYQKGLQEIVNSLNISVSSIYKMATHDNKTGIYNNNFFETLLEIEFDKCKRKKQTISLSLLDIDFFKKINDKYGHIKADDLLKRVAKIIQKNLKKSDIVARFGGEEFIILFSETNLNQAKINLTKLQKKIHSDRILKKYKLTLSGGVTEFKKGDTIKKMKERTDKALYMAKDKGRDQFVAII